MQDGLDIFMQVLSYGGAIGVAIFSIPEVINIAKFKRTHHLNKILFIILFLASLCFFVSGVYFCIKSTEVAFQAAVTTANGISMLSSGFILVQKFWNIHNAKKLGITEAEFAQKRVKKV
ncbi:hypothetical protein [Mesomycoplasma hyorhinis]|uniref:hypothetical protein n=1 Tax=Mesomycoplasma hyorhinis TaxID=2100 RepID=UPI001C03AED7|nr:hypothetical protein [Mesomycoplasma hyorhinis]UVT32125.1 hypothetical protein NV227_02825 [Mesomycoplasma hyorhinis]UVT32803.1 hypothetical protein NV228_02740 [Mesomycoplasma hyorhinis]UVT33479.1 hypothetical protein NV229_02730 [Mesomycoplasma hyorhinis]